MVFVKLFYFSGLRRIFALGIKSFVIEVL